MHDALSYPRFHSPKSHILGVYNTTSGETTVENQKGQHFRTMGKADSEGRLNLLPEETLYLIERGTLDVRWPDSAGEPLAGMPFSLQSAYTYFLGSLGLTLERYTVYAGLKRSGYIVQRGPAWYSSDKDNDIVEPRNAENLESPSVFTWLYKSLLEARPTDPAPLGPLIGLGLHRSYS